MRRTGLGILATLVVLSPPLVGQTTDESEPPSASFEPAEEPAPPTDETQPPDEGEASPVQGEPPPPERPLPQPPAQSAPVQPPAPSQPPPAAPAYLPPPGAGPYGPPYPPPAEPRKETFVVSLTTSPLHLLLPVFELFGEIRLKETIALSVFAGYGAVTDRSVSPSTDFTVWEVGGQFVFYPSDDFQSLQLGAEITYLHVATDSIQQTSTTGEASGVAIGPLVGYKLITGVGFTFVVQGGVQYVAVGARAQSPTGVSAEDEDADYIPLLNLNLGWSF